MITPAYVQIMTKYNMWQNKQLNDVVDVMDQDVLNQDRGAFFGSIQTTLSHLLWGDRIWMSRFDAQSEPPEPDTKGGVEMWPTKLEWAAARRQCDERICAWARTLQQADLDGDLTWFSGLAGKEFCRPKAFSITHFFNHQTHHRGQVHAMLTAADAQAPVSDLLFMPDDL